jgi:glucoamylase
MSHGSRVWFTMSEGIVSEIFFPQLDTPAIRDLQFMVTDRRGFFSDQRRDTICDVKAHAPGLPAYRMENRCKQGRYHIEQEIIADPDRSVLLIKVRLVPFELDEPRLYLLVAPHLCNRGWGNHAWVQGFKGEPMLFARNTGIDGPNVLAIGCSVPFIKRSVGYCGTSDGWQDVSQHRRMEWEYDAAPDGNVALTAELDTAHDMSFVIAVGFGTSFAGAAHHVLASLLDGFDDRFRKYSGKWQGWLRTLEFPNDDALGDDTPAKVSAAVLRIHEAKEYPGAMVASLSTPWGEYRGDGEAGYHMVWTRDLIESIGGLIAVGAHGRARRVLTFLHATQEPDGHWAQNMYVDGRSHWKAIQMDEIGFPILLALTAARSKTLDAGQLARFWPTIHKAVLYLLRHGPLTPLDRWEQFSGYSVFSLAVEISAIKAAASYAAAINEKEFAETAQRVALEWDSKLDDWMYVRDTALARKVGVEGYYAFIIPTEPSDVLPAQRPVPVRHWTGEGAPLAGEIVSPDALALVRFGLRAPDDPRILNTLKAIDATLRVETETGPCWRRFIGDGYGESETGEPFRDDSNGFGRPWPLLVGERAHYELAAGNRDEAIRLMHVMESFANASGLIPEQIWDAADLPAKGLYTRHPTGSATPLVWAHAEYLKLRRSIHDGRVFDLPAELEETPKKSL